MFVNKVNGFFPRDSGTFSRSGGIFTPGGVIDFIETLILSAPDGCYAGAQAVVVGANTKLRFVINGVLTGALFDSPSTFPATLLEGDEVRVRDELGNYSNILTALDPLFGITALLDLRTHKGNNVPFGIAPNGVANPTWSGVTGSAAQATVASQPITQLESGTPFLDFDGTNDFMIFEPAALTLDWSLIALIRQTGDGVIAALSTSTQPQVRNGSGGNNVLTVVNFSGTPFDSGVNPVSPDTWMVVSFAVVGAMLTFRVNGSPLTGGGDIGFIGTLDSIGAINGLFNFFNGGMIALHLSDSALTTDQIERVENYFQTLKPT